MTINLENMDYEAVHNLFCVSIIQYLNLKNKEKNEEGANAFWESNVEPSRLKLVEMTKQ